MKTSIPSLQKLVDETNKRNKRLSKPLMELIIDELKEKDKKKHAQLNKLGGKTK